MKSLRLTLIMNVFVLLASSILTSGCAVPNIRVSDTLFEKNPIQKIAVIAEGQVYKVNDLTNEYGIELLWSKQPLEIMTPDICDLFKKKGYEVVFCEVAGVGFRGRNASDRWVYEDDAQGNIIRKHIQFDVLYEYPIMKTRADLQAAIKNVFQEFEESIYRNQDRLFMPAQSDMRTIGRVVGADTVCLSRITGLRHSRGLLALLPIQEQKKDTVAPYIVCVAASNGEVLWQYDQSLYAYYSSSADDHYFSYREKELSAMFEYFPGRDKLMDAKFKVQTTNTAVQEHAAQKEKK